MLFSSLPNEVDFIRVMEMTGGNGYFRDCKLILVHAL